MKKIFNKKAQLDQAFSFFPVFLLIFFMGAVFIILSVGLSNLKNPTSPNQESFATNLDILLKEIDVSMGELNEINPEEAYKLQGKFFLEQDYIIVDKGPFTGGGRIFAISNDKRKEISLAEGMIRAGKQDKDFSYYRYIFDKGIEDFLLNDNAFSDEEKICLFLSIFKGTAFRSYFFMKEKGKISNLVARKGIDTPEFLGGMRDKMKEYFDSSSKVLVVVDGEKREITSYYGRCL